MSIDPNTLSLILYPSPVLREKAEEIDPSDPIVQAVAHRMIELMCKHDGAGLAAPQVGLSWRLFVTRPPSVWDPEESVGSGGPEDTDEETQGVAWINPTIELVSDNVAIGEEGCLSLPNIRGNVRRAVEVEISGFDIDGQPVAKFSDQFIARVWQHEYDHLDGILIIDKMSAMDRLVNRRQVRELERAY